MVDLSFDFDKDFVYSHKNDFNNGNIHYLYSVGIFLFWVDTTDGIVTHITETLFDEIATWYFNNENEDYNITEAEHKVHLVDVKCLNENYIPKIQELIKYI